MYSGSSNIRTLPVAGEILEVEPAIKPLGQKGGYAIGHVPAVDFVTADTHKRWVQAMREAGASPSIEAKAWKVLFLRSLGPSRMALGHYRQMAA